MTDKKFTSDDLKRLQNGDLNDKIGIAQARIMEFITRTDGKFYVSFSGGKDSTVLAYIAAQCCCLMGNKKLTLWHSDTGLEFPELRKHVKDYEQFLKKEFPNIEIELVIEYPTDKKGNRITFRQVIEKCGYPIITKPISRQIHDVQTIGDNCWAAGCFNGKETGMYNMQKWKYVCEAPFKVSNQCCNIMKKTPANKFSRKTGLYPIIGVMASESKQRKNDWIKNGCNSFEGKHIASKPLSVWTDSDVLEYIVKYELPYPSVYGDIIHDDDGKYYTTGERRTGCMFCGYGCHLEKEPNRFQRLKQTHPKIWEYCMRPWKDGGLGMREVLNYIHVDVE